MESLSSETRRSVDADDVDGVDGGGNGGGRAGEGGGRGLEGEGGVGCVCYICEARSLPGKFDVAKAKALKVPHVRMPRRLFGLSQAIFSAEIARQLSRLHSSQSSFSSSEFCGELEHSRGGSVSRVF